MSSTTHDNIINEKDNVFISGIDMSIGTLIKHAAKLIFNDKGYENLNNKEKKIMINGLSSIIDLNDSSVNSQISLFNAIDQWNELKNTLLYKHAIERITPPLLVTQIWKVVTETIKRIGEYNKGLRYIDVCYYKVLENEQYMLDIYRLFIRCIQNYPEYLTKPPGRNISKNDYIRILWSPLLELLFINNRDIQITCASLGTNIDIRIIYKFQGSSILLVIGEVARNISQDTIIEYTGNLSAEGKDILDTYVKNNCTAIFPWLLKIEGCTISFSTMHLTAPGLYAHLPRFNGSFPTSFFDMEKNVPTLLAKLITFKNSILLAVDELKKSLMNKFNIEGSPGEARSMFMSPKILWVRPTFHMPPRDDNPVIPQDLYGAVPPILEGVCEFGWYRDETDGMFHNKYTDAVRDEHFCCPE